MPPAIMAADAPADFFIKSLLVLNVDISRFFSLGFADEIRENIRCLTGYNPDLSNTREAMI
jgi:hypothetical protein